MSTTSNFNTVRVLSKSEFENNFSSTSNDTLHFVEMDNTMFDGQWVHKYLLANTNATKGVYSIDLSEYLPDNLYWYEINASVNIYTSSSSNTNGNTEIANYLTNSYVGYDSAGDSRNYFYLHIEYDQYNENASDTFTMIIPPDRQIIMKAIWGTNSSTNELHLISYRRLGTNV